MKNNGFKDQQVLPTQEKFFSTEKLRKSARAGTHLPDPTMVPYGYDAKQHFGHLFPKLELPALFPPGSHHPDEGAGFLSWVSTHAKRRAADAWCRQRGMVYRFIENSRGALFVQNNSLANLEQNTLRQKKVVRSINDL